MSDNPNTDPFVQAWAPFARAWAVGAQLRPLPERVRPLACLEYRWRRTPTGVIVPVTWGLLADSLMLYAPASSTCPTCHGPALRAPEYEPRVTFCLAGTSPFGALSLDEMTEYMGEPIEVTSHRVEAAPRKIGHVDKHGIAHFPGGRTLDLRPIAFIARRVEPD